MKGKLILILCLFFISISAESWAQCTTPTNLTADSPESGAITFSWDDMSATNYQIQYRLAGSTWMSAFPTTNSHTATSLTDGTYNFRVRARCSGSYTVFTALLNFTLGSSGGGTCGVPTNATASSAAVGSITFSWDDMSASNYQLQYRLAGGAWMSAFPTSNTHTVSGLTDGTYNYRIRARCNGSYTAFTGLLNYDLSGGGASGNGGSVWTDENTHIFYDKKVLIGPSSTTLPGDYGLYVTGGILAEKAKIALSNNVAWADYVFANDYKRNSIEYIEEFIKKHKHLPNVPSAAHVQTNGIDVVEMDATLLRQIEEIWLYVIEMQKQNDVLKSKIKELESK